MSKAKIPASLGGIEFDCTISRERTYEADVPEYPVEGGFTVSDAILKKPLGLEVVVFVTNMPVTWAKIHAGSNRVKTVSDALVNLYLSGKPVSFVTPDKVYENMAITKLSLPEEDYANAIEIALSLKQVKISAAKILKDAADKLSLPVSYSATAQEILERSYFSNGYSFVGYAQYVLDDACSKASIMWTIQNGVLQVRRSSEGISTALHKLNKDTGLINIPKRVYSTQTANTDSSIDTTSDMLYGYEIEYFMNGAIGIGDRVYVESSLVKGVYMVSKLQIEGDNIEGNWQCTAQITEVS